MPFIEFLLSHIDDYWEGWIKNTEGKIQKKNRKNKKWSDKGLTSYIHFSKKIRGIKELITLKSFLLDKKSIQKYSFNPLLFFLKRVPIFKREKIIQEWKELKKLIKNPSKPWKIRPLMYADHKDSVIYSWYAYILSCWYEQIIKKLWFQDCIAAYRNDNSTRTNSSVSRDLFDILKKQSSDKKYRIILLDVKKFYDTLDPVILKKMWCKVLQTKSLPEDHFSVFKSIVDYAVIDTSQLRSYFNNKGINLNKRNIWKLCTDKEFHEIRKATPSLIANKKVFLSFLSNRIDPLNPFDFYDLVKKEPIPKGIPQWLVISPVLANIYMIDFDCAINLKIQTKGWFYRRYADDIGIICEDWDADEIIWTINDEISKLWLVIQETKTQQYIYEKGVVAKMNEASEGEAQAFTYLGLTYRQNKWFIRNGTISKWYQKIYRIIRQSFWRKKAWEKITSEQVFSRVMSLWLFRYIRLCTKDHWAHILKQFSRKKIKKMTRKLLEWLDEYISNTDKK